jgi:hypothetical protein
VPRQGLVHGIVDHFGEQVMQRLLVGAADVHAGPPAHRLQAFQYLDVVGGIGVAVAIARRFRTLRRRAGGGRLGEQVAGRRWFLCGACRLGYAVPMRLCRRLTRSSCGRGKCL